MVSKRMMMGKQEVIDELHRSARRNFRRRRVIIKGLDDLWQADLVEMGVYSTENNGYRYMLTVIDTFSKFAWVRPIKNKSGVEVTNAFRSILGEGRQPKNLQTDDGKEFYNHNFNNLMRKFNINHYSTYSVLKASIVERFNRTLKTMMWKKFSMNGSYRWIQVLPDLLTCYNTRKHRTIKMSPIDVNKSNEQQLLSTIYNRMKIAASGKYKIGDFVRISKFKHVFEKGYTPNWTTEIFKIAQVKHTNPVTYMLEDYQGKNIKGGFYEMELMKTKYPDVYLVEKVIRKKGDKAFVKWLGFPSEHNSWIREDEIL